MVTELTDRCVQPVYATTGAIPRQSVMEVIMDATPANQMRALDDEEIDRVSGGISSESYMTRTQTYMSTLQATDQLAASIVKRMNDTTSSILHNFG
jgi:hypothetical protein